MHACVHAPGAPVSLPALARPCGGLLQPAISRKRAQRSLACSEPSRSAHLSGAHELQLGPWRWSGSIPLDMAIRDKCPGRNPYTPQRRDQQHRAVATGGTSQAPAATVAALGSGRGQIFLIKRYQYSHHAHLLIRAPHTHPKTYGTGPCFLTGLVYDCAAMGVKQWSGNSPAGNKLERA